MKNLQIKNEYKMTWLKNSITGLFALAMLAGASVASAVALPGWERPLEKAYMEIIKSDDFFGNVENVVLVRNRRDEAKEEATSLTLNFDRVNGDSTVQNLQFEVPVEKVIYNRCGGTSFVATVKLYNPDMPTGFFPEIQIVMKRQGAMGGIPACSGQFVMNENQTTWTAKIKYIEKGSSDLEANMTVQGNPEILYTIQGPETF